MPLTHTLFKSSTTTTRPGSSLVQHTTSDHSLSISFNSQVKIRYEDMGLFSSRKEDSDASVTSTPKKEDKSVIQAIRSRFHGKKGKEREAPFSTSIASIPLVSDKHPPRSIISIPSFRRTTLDRTAASIPLSHERARLAEPISNPEAARSNRPFTHQASGPSTSVVSRRTTDSVTVTLAQRLNELASANSEGLLSDDEYRILRQSLFERFASNAAVPSEASLVPVTSTITPDPEALSSRHISNFQIDRPPSIISKSSGTSGSHNLLRRVMDRRPTTNDKSDTSSLMSTKSHTSLFKIPRLLSRKASDSSVRTTASRVQTDTISVSSRRFSSDKGHREHPLSPSTPRSTAGSIRRMPVPPSSFNARLISQARHSTIYNVFDEDHHLSSVQDIQQQISNVESEQKRLMDAFNGLELTTLARRHRVPPFKRSTEFGKVTTAVDSIFDGRSQRHDLTDDGISLHSHTSAGTSPSVMKSVYALRSKVSLSSHMALPLFRKGSLASVDDDRRTPIPLPSSNSVSQRYLQAASNSNISLHSRSSKVGVNTMLDDENPIPAVQMDFGHGLEGELEDIRRRREEVNNRYEARLEYLQAKLKGAQLHEKLMRR